MGRQASLGPRWTLPASRCARPCREYPPAPPPCVVLHLRCLRRGLFWSAAALSQSEVAKRPVRARSLAPCSVDILSAVWRHGLRRVTPLRNGRIRGHGDVVRQGAAPDAISSAERDAAPAPAPRPKRVNIVNHAVFTVFVGASVARARPADKGRGELGPRP